MAADSKMAVVAFLIISMLVVSSVPMATAQSCFQVCYDRCANGKNNVACATMCSQACIVPKFPFANTDPSMLVNGK